MSDDRVTSVLPEEPPRLDTGEATSSDPLGRKVRLIILAGAQIGRKYTLSDQSTIGRASTCTVPIDDSLASRVHASITRDHDGTYVLRDLSSRNGTLLNGRRASSDVIRFGDRIQIGSTLLLFSPLDPLEDRILQRQKLEAIGRLGAGIAHDINNLLGAVLSNIDFLTGLPQTTELSDREVRECFDEIRLATRRGADLTRRILAFSKRGTGEHAVTDLSSLCDEAIDLARRTFDRSLKIERHVVANLRVRGDRGHLHQMIMNLLLNARDAMPHGGTLTVDVRLATTEEAAAHAALGAGRLLVVRVKDTGIGMTPDVKRHIFEPFFTTKPAEKGSGLGLATVMDVVTAHGGHIECDSEPGVGTTFRILLPAVSTVEASMRNEMHTPMVTLRGPLVQQLAQMQRRRKGTILVVDDESMVRRSLSRLLRREGHRVLEVEHGGVALERYAEHAADVDVVLMDLDMPELDGEATQEVLAKRFPGVRIVFLTGYCDEARRKLLIARGAAAVLQKPCDGTTLMRTIDDVLGSEPAPSGQA